MLMCVPCAISAGPFVVMNPPCSLPQRRNVLCVSLMSVCNSKAESRWDVSDQCRMLLV